ncbi:MAG: hypothetical protein ACK413_03060 [Patescibacteria group bacterium]
MKEIIIVNKKRLERLVNLIKKDGPSEFFVLSDFDGTLTKFFYQGKKRPSLISILRDENYLTPQYSKEAKALYEKYHLIEIDPKIPIKEKFKKMEEWWRIHFKLLAKYGLKKGHLKKAVKLIMLREGFSKFVSLLRKKSIPLIIISSSGLGIDAILMVLAKKKKLSNNIFIISNILKWDKKGNFIRAEEPIVHSLNKDGTIIKKFPKIFEKIKRRKNILLLANDIHDLKMLNGFSYKNVIKIGFLNEKTKENLKEYKKNFDVLILKDGKMNFINNLLKNLFN